MLKKEHSQEINIVRREPDQPSRINDSVQGIFTIVRKRTVRESGFQFYRFDI